MGAYHMLIALDVIRKNVAVHLREKVMINVDKIDW